MIAFPDGALSTFGEVHSIAVKVSREGRPAMLYACLGISQYSAHYKVEIAPDGLMRFRLLFEPNGETRAIGLEDFLVTLSRRDPAARRGRFYGPYRSTSYNIRQHAPKFTEFPNPNCFLFVNKRYFGNYLTQHGSFDLYDNRTRQRVNVAAFLGIEV